MSTYELAGPKCLGWTTVNVHLTYDEIVSQHLYEWCNTHTSGWTMWGITEFAFKNPDDAFAFRMKV